MARKSTKGDVGSEILTAFNAKSYRLRGLITLNIISSVRTNDVKLDAAFEDNRIRQRALNDQLNIILGIKESKMLKGKPPKVSYTDSAALFFEHNSTARTNFAHMLKECTRAAAAVIDMRAKATMVLASGALAISGPGVENEFGAATVLLNEKVAEGMKQKPSYAALSAIAMRNRGLVPERGSNTRGFGEIASEETSLENECRAFAHVIRKIAGTPTKRQLDALRAVRSAIDLAIE